MNSSLQKYLWFVNVLYCYLFFHKNMISAFKKLTYFFWLTILAFLAATIVAVICIKNLNNSLYNLNESASSIRDLEQNLCVTYNELNKTIRTLNSSNLIDDELKSKAYKLSMLQAIHMAKLKLKNGNDIIGEINVINQFATNTSAILAAELKNIYNSKLPPNSFFLSAVSELIYKKNASVFKNHNLSAVEQILEKFVKVEEVDKQEDRDILLFVLHSLEHNDTEHALEIIKKLADRYPSLKEIEPSLQLKSNVNYILNQLMTQILENV